MNAHGRDRKRIHHKDGWVESLPKAVRDFNVMSLAFTFLGWTIFLGTTTRDTRRRSERSTTPNKQPKDGTIPGPSDPVPTQAPAQSGSSGATSSDPSGGGGKMPRGPPVDNAPPAPLRSGGSGGDGGGPGPPAGRVVPPRDDMDWRDRAIRAEALMERVQGELQESKDRNTELRIQNLEAQNRNLYGQACVAEEWNVWFQDQQEKGFLAGYHQETPQQSPRSTPRGTPARGRSTRGRSQSDDEGYISRSSTPQRSRSGFFRRGKMGDRSMTPTRKGGGRSPTPTPSGGVAGRSFADRTDHSTTFGDGHDTMEIIFEETLKVVPGIDNDPDDATPWADNLTFPDLMDLAWTIKRTVPHNARFWWRPNCHDQPLPFTCDRSLRTWPHTVLWFEPGSIRIMLRDAPMDAQVPPLGDLPLPSGESRRFMALARPALADAGFMDPGSTYKGERKPEGQGKKRQQREESRGAYKGDGPKNHRTGKRFSESERRVAEHQVASALDFALMDPSEEAITEETQLDE
ncbi:unnamed protein product, partial [Symbiodinium sp. KB8]